MKHLFFLFISVIFFSCSSSNYRTDNSTNNKPARTTSEHAKTYWKREEIKATPEQMQHEFIKLYDGISKDLIFERSIKWIAQNFKSAKQVIDYQDKEAGSIIAKGIIPDVQYTPSIDSTISYTVSISFTLTFDTKDAKARYSYTNVNAIDKSDFTKDLPLVTESAAFQLKAQEVLENLTEEISTAILSKDDF